MGSNIIFLAWQQVRVSGWVANPLSGCQNALPRIVCSYCTYSKDEVYWGEQGGRNYLITLLNLQVILELKHLMQKTSYFSKVTIYWFMGFHESQCSFSKRLQLGFTVCTHLYRAFANHSNAVEVQRLAEPKNNQKDKELQTMITLTSLSKLR